MFNNSRTENFLLLGVVIAILSGLFISALCTNILCHVLVEISTIALALLLLIRNSRRYTLALVRDISERKKMDAAIRESEERFRLLVELSPDLIFIRHKESIVYANPAAVRMTGAKDVEELIGRSVLDFALPERREYLKTLIAANDAQPLGTVMPSYVGTLVRLDGSFFSIELMAVRFLYQGMECSQQIMRDITDRKQADDLLRKQEREFRTLAESLPDNIVRYDRHGVTLYVNAALEKTVGVAAAKRIGTRVREFYTDGSYERYAQAVDDVLEDGEDREIEFIVPGSDVKPAIHQIRFIAERGEEDEVTGVLAIGRDITGSRLAEEERLTNLRFFENLDRINRAIQGAQDFEQMMCDVLEVTLSIFACDRAFLLTPCDPEASVWRVPMERTNPAYPGAGTLENDYPMSPDIAEKFRTLLASDGPVQFGPDSLHPLSPDLMERFNITSLMSMALRLNNGSTWEFGIQHCSSPKQWSASDENLLREIGRRLADGLTSMLMFCNLQESEDRFRLVFENSPVSIWEEDFSGVKQLFDDLRKNGVSDIEHYFDNHPELVQKCAGLVRIIDVNHAALTLHDVTSKEELIASLVKTFTPESFDTFRRELIWLWQGKTVMTADAVVKTMAGDPRHVTVCFTICPGYEETLAKCLVSLVDITERKQAEETILEKERHVSSLALELTNSEERERRRLATDLHDTLGQDLALARIRLGTIIKEGSAEGQRVKSGEILDLLENAINHVRKLTRLLCPPILESSGLEAALKWLGRQIASDYDLQIEFSDDLQDKPVSREFQLEIYNSVRELLINVAKHAGADTVLLSLSFEEDMLVITVEDDGVGFSVSSVLGKLDIDGFGLHIIMRRIVHLGGTFSIDSAPGTGARAVIRVPVQMNR